MPPILVLSVPHSGTFFALSLMPGARGAWDGTYEEGKKYFCHIRDPLASQAIEKCFVVIPLRNYSDVVKSWQRDRMDVDDLYLQWHEVLEVSKGFHLNIDSPDQREFQLKKISAALGVEIISDWSVMHSSRPV